MYFLNPHLFWPQTSRLFIFFMLVNAPMSLHIFLLYNAVYFAD